MEESPLRASVVIPTHGRRSSLVRVLQALGQQTAPADTFEVVVVCDGDVDGSAEACRALAGDLPYSLRVIEQPNQGPAAARNRGVAEARGELIVFIDDDVVPDAELLAVHMAAQSGEDALVAVGPLLPPTDFKLNAWGAWEEDMLLRQYIPLSEGRWQPTYRQFYTGNASVLKRHIVAVGGFNEEFRRAEDVHLGLRLRFHGLHYAFLPAAKGWHYVQRSFDAWQRMATAYGVADVELGRTVQVWVLELVVRDYHYRHWMVRGVSQLAVGRPALIDSICLGLGLVARTMHALGSQPLRNAACSVLFNMRYYDGVARALGSRKAFHNFMRHFPAAPAKEGARPAAAAR